MAVVEGAEAESKLWSLLLLGLLPGRGQLSKLGVAQDAGVSGGGRCVGVSSGRTADSSPLRRFACEKVDTSDE